MLGYKKTGISILTLLSQALLTLLTFCILLMVLTLATFSTDIVVSIWTNNLDGFWSYPSFICKRLQSSCVKAIATNRKGACNNIQIYRDQDEGENLEESDVKRLWKDLCQLRKELVTLYVYDQGMWIVWVEIFEQMFCQSRRWQCDRRLREEAINMIKLCQSNNHSERLICLNCALSKQQSS